MTIDLKDAYFDIEILPENKKLLRFTFKGKALPFGLALSPHI